MVLMLGIQPTQASAGAVEENKRVVLEMIAAVNARDLDALDAIVSSDVRRHSAATPGVVVENLEEFKAFLETDFSSVPDSEQTVNLILAEGEMVAVHATYAGTQSGAMGPFPPSGKRLEIPFIGILRLEDGKIIEIWVEWDNFGPLIGLGHLAPPGAPAVPEETAEE